jgi:hypothetical protein
VELMIPPSSITHVHATSTHITLGAFVADKLWTYFRWPPPWLDQCVLKVSEVSLPLDGESSDPPVGIHTAAQTSALIKYDTGFASQVRRAAWDSQPT